MAERCLWMAVYQEWVCGSASPSPFWWRSKTLLLRKESLKYEPITVNKKKLCINPGAIATSLGHSFLFLFPFTPPVALLSSPLLHFPVFNVQKPDVCDAKKRKMWATSLRFGVLMCVLDMPVVKTPKVGDARVTLSKKSCFTSGPFGAERSELNDGAFVAALNEWCQTTCFRSSRRGHFISGHLVCVRLGSRPKANIRPASSLHIVLSLSITQCKYICSRGRSKNHISHQPLCFSLSVWRIWLPLSHTGMLVFTKWACVRFFISTFCCASWEVKTDCK